MGKKRTVSLVLKPDGEPEIHFWTKRNPLPKHPVLVKLGRWKHEYIPWFDDGDIKDLHGEVIFTNDEVTAMIVAHQLKQ